MKFAVFELSRELLFLTSEFLSMFHLFQLGQRKRSPNDQSLFAPNRENAIKRISSNEVECLPHKPMVYLKMDGFNHFIAVLSNFCSIEFWVFAIVIAQEETFLQSEILQHGSEIQAKITALPRRIIYSSFILLKRECFKLDGQSAILQ